MNQLYLHGQIPLFMLTNMICIPIRQEKIKKLLDVFGNVSRSFLSFVKESFFAHAPLGLYRFALAQAAKALHFFARTKKRSKEIRRLHFFAYSGTFLH